MRLGCAPMENVSVLSFLTGGNGLRSLNEAVAALFSCPCTNAMGLPSSETRAESPDVHNIRHARHPCCGCRKRSTRHHLIFSCIIQFERLEVGAKLYRQQIWCPLTWNDWCPRRHKLALWAPCNMRGLRGQLRGMRPGRDGCWQLVDPSCLYFQLVLALRLPHLLHNLSMHTRHRSAWNGSLLR